MSDEELRLEPDIKSKYTEGCSALRHYSVCVLNTRTITIAQGFAILTGAIYTIKEGLFRSELPPIPLPA
jgi:hypothetical protein